MTMTMPDMTMTIPMPDMTMIAFPPAPALGAQIDRMGRPGINTVLTDPFDTIAGTAEDAVKDSYNAAADPTTWDGAFHGAASMTTHSYLKGNLGIFDGLDVSSTPGDGCGTQLAADSAGVNARYDFLASVLADDELYIDTSQSVCGLYLGVEVAALGITIPDCGGRTPLEDVIDETYTLLSVGISGIMPNQSFVVTDGIARDADNPPQLATFPFLGAPN
jgi:hypothetical protein